MRLEWDPAKARANFKKHEISFDEAATVFNDPLSVTGSDPDHSLEEMRSLTFGISALGRLLVVAHADHEGVIRIITARRTARAERMLYEED